MPLGSPGAVALSPPPWQCFPGHMRDSDICGPLRCPVLLHGKDQAGY